MKSWMEFAIATLLRVGVVLSIGIIVIGMIVSLVHHPDFLSSRPAFDRLTAADSHFPSTIGEVIAGLRRGSGHAMITAGLLVLIATPVMRVALSIVIFLIERDVLYVVITATVFAILLISFAVGRAGA